jgi:GNAT superfamily N-acetyltransferase
MIHYPIYQIEIPVGGASQNENRAESVAFVNGFLTRDCTGFIWLWKNLLSINRVTTQAEGCVQVKAGICSPTEVMMVSYWRSEHNLVQQQFQAGRVWVAADCHEIVVGYAIAREVDETLYLQQLDVEPEHGRRGIGSALITTVCDWAQQQGYSIVSLSTFRDLPWNAPFYSKMGFHPVDEAKLTTGFQQIRLKELEAGLPISERVVMSYKLAPTNCLD